LKGFLLILLLGPYTKILLVTCNFVSYLANKTNTLNYFKTQFHEFSKKGHLERLLHNMNTTRILFKTFSNILPI